MKKVIIFSFLIVISISMFGMDNLFEKDELRLGIGMVAKPFTSGMVSVKNDFNKTYSGSFMVMLLNDELSLGVNVSRKLRSNTYGTLYTFAEQIYDVKSIKTAENIEKKEHRTQTTSTIGLGIETSALFFYNFFIPLKMSESPVNFYIETGINKPWLNYYDEIKKPEFGVLILSSFGIHYYF